MQIATASSVENSQAIVDLSNKSDCARHTGAKSAEFRCVDQKKPAGRTGYRPLP
jgi:hypothetical protein